MIDVLNYVGGELLRAKSGSWLDSFEPATGQVFARITDSDAGEVDAAVAAAEQALPAWIALGREGRSNAMLRVAALVVHRRSLGAFLGYQLREQSGPHPVGLLMRWVHRDARLVPWASVTQLGPDLVTVEVD